MDGTADEGITTRLVCGDDVWNIGALFEIVAIILLLLLVAMVLIGVEIPVDVKVC